MSGMWIMKNPKGITGTLMKLKQGGVSTVMQGSDGQIAGTTSLFSAKKQAVILGVFTAMSIVCQQYFLTQINSELKILNQKLDKILDFLYGEKKAELLSEILFIQRSIRDFTSIMEHDTQRIATISGIQQSEKIALKDIEFYIHDLESTVHSELDDKSAITDAVKTAQQICESLDASLQLYIMSTILEVHYSQNTDSCFIENLKSDLSVYIAKCHTRMLAAISVLRGKIDSFSSIWGKLDKDPLIKQLTDITEPLQQNKTMEMQQMISAALDSVRKESTFVITQNDEIYYQAS